MVFAPKMEGGTAYNQPIDTPNAMSAVAGLFDFGVKSLVAKSGNAPSLTENEKFARDIKDFEESEGIGGGVNWDRARVRKAIFSMPQHREKIMGYADELGVMTTVPQEVARDAVADWAKTPEGATAAAAASNMEDEEGAAFMAQQFTYQMQQEAEIAKLKRQEEKYTLEGTIATRQWDTLKATQKSFVDNAVQGVVSGIVTDVMQGRAVEVPPELAAQMGIRYSTIDMSNLPAFLNDTKIALANQGRAAYLDNFGQDTLPPEAWSEEVYSSIDGLIEVTKQIDSPQEQAAAMSALIGIQATKQLDAAGVAVAIEIFKSIPADSAAMLFPDLSSLSGPLSKVIAPGVGGRLFSTQDIKGNVIDLSKRDAELVAKDTMRILSDTMTPEFFIAFKESAKKSGYNVVDGASFKEIVGGNLPKIKELTSTNPEFRAEFSDWVTSDIQQTISIINSNLIAGVSLEFDGKGYVLVPTPGTLAADKWNDPYRPYKQSALNQLPDGLTLDTLNEKINSLGLLGDVGKEVQGAIGILNAKPKEDIFNNIENIEPTSGTVTKSSKGGGTDIGASLGIDFAKYEADNALPSGFLNKVAYIESGGNPKADNPTSSAGGLFQQIDSNAKAYGVADRYDPVQSTEGAVRFAVENKRYLSGVLGREPTGGELYLAHQQGPGGAAKLLSNPDTLAVDIVGKKAVELNGGNASMTAGEFANIWISKYNGSRGQTSVASSTPSTPTAPTSVRSDSASMDAEVMTNAQPLNIPAEGVGRATEGLTAEQVAQLVERVKEAPEKAVQVVEEAMAGRPVDPMIKALIEALVGNKA